MTFSETLSVDLIWEEHKWNVKISGTPQFLIIINDARSMRRQLMYETFILACVLRNHHRVKTLVLFFIVRTNSSNYDKFCSPK